MRATQHRICLSVDLGADPAAPPTEFRLFKAGKNPTTKGVFLFDEAAAKAVMTAFVEQGVDLIMDLEHLSLDPKSPNYDPDARAHYQLAVRDGELWAVNVRWTEDGKRRLAEKTQRYPSPAFLADEDGRILEMVNTALVAMPATHGAPALVAAARLALVQGDQTRALVYTALAILAQRGGAPPKVKYTVGRIPHRLNMDPEKLKAALEALKAEDGAKALAILEDMLVSMAGGAPADPGADAMSDTAETPADDPDKPAELAALRKQVETLAKAQSEEIVALRATVASLTAERDAKDQTERVALVAELVKLGYETPATAWEGEPEKLKPAAELQAMPIAKLRTRVELFRKSPRTANAEPAESGPAEIKLSKAEQEYCTKHGLTPEQFEAKKKAAARTAK